MKFNSKLHDYFGCHYGAWTKPEKRTVSRLLPVGTMEIEYQQRTCKTCGYVQERTV